MMFGPFGSRPVSTIFATVAARSVWWDDRVLNRFKSFGRNAVYDGSMAVYWQKNAAQAAIARLHRKIIEERRDVV